MATGTVKWFNEDNGWYKKGPQATNVSLPSA